MKLDEAKMLFRDSLVKGRYNLLLGSGVSLDSRNGRGDCLPSADVLRTDLCAATGAPSNTSLSRVAGLLDGTQVDELLTQRFKDCLPGPSLSGLTHYLWRRIFTFNIDDVLEECYLASRTTKQELVPLNFDAPFEPTPERSELLAIHLHGWVQQSESGYVFSTAEYARGMSRHNPWMHLLSEILSTEPFIVAGTSLNEVDLEYYLSFRSSKTPRRDRGPSVLVEPFPDVVTKAICEQHGLALFEGTFGDFLAWLRAEIPNPPTVHDLIVPDETTLFGVRPTPRDLVAFFSDFELVKAGEASIPAMPPGFLYGRQPRWLDIDAHLDVEREDNARVLAQIRRDLSDLGNGRKALIILDHAGTGKTTTARRVAHDLVSGGVPVLSVCTTARIDPEVSARCLRQLAAPAVVLVDGIADHAEQVVQFLDDPAVADKVVLLATERVYRKDYLNVVFGGTDREFWSLKDPSEIERTQLLERYRRYGLIGTHIALKRPEHFVSALSGDPMAVAICRIMNDFKPLAEIVRSLWHESDAVDRSAYMCVALAEHCVRTGLRYSLLQSIVGQNRSIAHLLGPEAPLGITVNTIDDDYVVSVNGAIADQVLLRTARIDRSAVGAAFQALAGALAPHVNVPATLQRSPEARLAGRLFDWDKIVRPLLGDGAEAFYVAVQHQWEWNSRYWEQRALLAAETDLDTAINYARHAVAIHLHSFPLTTLGKILLMEMEAVPARRDIAYAEAVMQLTKAIEREYKRSRISVHPYATLLTGTEIYLVLGGDLSHQQREVVSTYLEEARDWFRDDVQVVGIVERLGRLL